MLLHNTLYYRIYYWLLCNSLISLDFFGTFYFNTCNTYFHAFLIISYYFLKLPVLAAAPDIPHRHLPILYNTFSYIISTFKNMFLQGSLIFILLICTRGHLLGASISTISIMYALFRTYISPSFFYNSPRHLHLSFLYCISIVNLPVLAAAPDSLSNYFLYMTFIDLSYIILSFPPFSHNIQ